MFHVDLFTICFNMNWVIPAASDIRVRTDKVRNCRNRCTYSNEVRWKDLWCAIVGATTQVTDTQEGQAGTDFQITVGVLVVGCCACV